MVALGVRLKEARLKKGLSLEEVSKATKIKPSFLQALEKGEYENLPSSAYAFGFVSNYASYLGMPKKETLAMFRREFAGEKIDKVLPEGMSKTSALPGLRISQTVFVFLGIFLLLAGYFLYQYRYAFIEPPLTVVSPEEGQRASGKIVVQGHTDPSVLIFVNGEPVPVDDLGGFEKSLELPEGNARIIIKAEHRLGQHNEEERIVTVL